MSSLKVSLYVAGAIVEGLGVLLVSWPDLAPLVNRMREATAAGVSRAISRVRRLLGRPQTHTISASESLGIALAGEARGKVSPSDGASLEGMVEFLLAQYDALDDRMHNLTVAQRAQREETEQQLAAARHAMEEHVAREIRNALDIYRGRRLAGIGLLIAGAVLLNIGNFVE